MTIDPMADTTDSVARENARQAAENKVEHDLSDLIAPSDLRGVNLSSNATIAWSAVDDGTLDRELAESASIMRSERQSPFNGIAHDTAIILCRNGLTRAPMSDLVFDSEEKAVEEGYWPHGVNRVEVTNLLRENKPDWWNHCVTEAWDSVGAGIYDGLDPRDD